MTQWDSEVRRARAARYARLPDFPLGAIEEKPKPVLDYQPPPSLRKPRGSSDAAAKARTVKLVLAGASVLEASVEMDISLTAVRKWCRAAGVDMSREALAARKAADLTP